MTDVRALPPEAQESLVPGSRAGFSSYPRATLSSSSFFVVSTAPFTKRRARYRQGDLKALRARPRGCPACRGTAPGSSPASARTPHHDFSRTCSQIQHHHTWFWAACSNESVYQASPVRPIQPVVCSGTDLPVSNVFARCHALRLPDCYLLTRPQRPEYWSR